MPRQRPHWAISTVALALAVRMLPALISSTTLSSTTQTAAETWPWWSLTKRVELSTPLTSIHRLRECAWWTAHSGDGMRSLYYAGGNCHHPPLQVWALRGWVGGSEVQLAALYAFIDVFLLGGMLYLIASMQPLYAKLFSPVVETIEDKDRDELAAKFTADVLQQEHISPRAVATTYLLHPFTILSCLSQSTVLFTNLVVVAAIWLAFKGYRSLSMLSLALSTVFSFYPWMLVLPVALLMSRAHAGKRSTAVSMAQCILTYLSWLGALAVATFLLLAGPAPHFNVDVQSVGQFVTDSLLGSEWFRNGLTAFHQHLLGTFGVILRVSDLTPNVGLYWYFFTEMFDTFRTFFVAVVQLHLISLVVPFTIKFREDPLFVVFLLSGMITVFKSYPSVGDVALMVAGLFPLQRKLFKYLRYPFFSLNLYFFSGVLLPFFHYIWIYAGTGNANFFYAITLLWSLAGVLLLTDCVYAWLRRMWDVELHLGNRAQLAAACKVNGVAADPKTLLLFRQADFVLK